MSDHTSLRRSFDAVATLYDEVRPGYPEMTINAIIELSELLRDAGARGA